MKKRLFLTFLSAILVLPLISPLTLAHGQDKDDDDDDDKPLVRPPALKPGEKPMDADFRCPYNKAYQRPEHFSGYTLRFHPGTKKPDDRCRATITSPNGAVTPVANNWALTVEKISGTDINGDGKPEIVIAGFSGEVRCCFTYTIAELGDTAHVIRKIQSRSPLRFEKQPDGSVLIRGVDSSLDYFLVPHPMAVVPQVFLRMQGGDLVDVSQQFQAQYDKLIDQARSELSSGDLEKFRQSRYNDKMFTDQLPTVRRVLTIVLNYLYSGREEQGWKALDEMWPPSDQGRVKNLIQQRRGRGLLAQLNAPNPGP